MFESILEVYSLMNFYLGTLNALDLLRISFVRPFFGLVTLTTSISLMRLFLGMAQNSGFPYPNKLFMILQGCVTSGLGVYIR